jgi:DNA polymerase
MGINTHIADYDWNAALAALAWQVELGVTEVMNESAIDRYELPEKQEPVIAKAKPAAPAIHDAPKVDTTLAAQTAANACTDLAALRAALGAFDHCALKKGARNLVFAQGNPTAPLLIVGEAPNREEDVEGRPFAGRAGLLLDKMLAAIGFARDSDTPATSAYLIPAVPWRPPADHVPSDDEIAMMRPFLLRHIALAKPRAIIAMGNTACTALLGQSGVLRLRGTWAEAESIPVMPMIHPAYLLKNHAAKRDAWADLLAVKSKLKP